MKNRQKLVFGLDVGTWKTCLLIARAHNDGRLDVVATGYSPSSGLKKGIVVNVFEAADSIRKASEEAEAKTKIPINSVVAGISGTHVRSQKIRGTVPIEGKHHEVSERDLDNAVRAARAVPLSSEREVIHMIPQEFLLDGRGDIKNPIGLSGSRLDVDLHVISCDNSLSQNLINAVNTAQIRVKRIILQSIASGEAVLTPEEKELGTAVVDIGAGTTGIAVFARNSVSFISVVPAGGSHFTQDLVEALLISREEAERIKVDFGNVSPELIASNEFVPIQGLGMRGGRDLARKTICGYLHDRGAELLELVGNEIARSGENLVGGVVLTGGGSMMGGIVELAANIFNMPVRQGIPIALGGLPDELKHPVFAGAVGLVMLGAQTTVRDFVDKPASSTSFAGRIISWFEK